MPSKVISIAKRSSSRVKNAKPVDASKSVQQPGRVRAARSTASLSGIQASIEKQFKLPKGSVALVAPGRRKMDDDAVIQDLRDRWASRQA